MRKVVIGVVVLLVLAACGGGDSDADTTAPGATATTGSGNGGGGGNGGAPGAGTDFCDLVDDIAETQDIAFDLGPDALEEAMKDAIDFADVARDAAPSDIDDAADTLFTGFEGFADALADVDYDPFTNQAAFLSDERVVYLDSDEYNAAGEAVDAYCGTGQASPGTTLPGGGTIPGDGTTPPAGGGSGDIPDNYPDDLIPPGVTATESISAGGTYSVTFMTDASFEDVVAFFEDAVGPPASNIEAGGVQTAQWVPDARLTTIIVVNDGTGVTAFVAGN